MSHPTAYVCVYYNDQICNTNESTTFISNNAKAFMVNKVITLKQLIELVQQKINIKPHQHIQHLYFRCPIFEPGQSHMYTCFIQKIRVFLFYLSESDSPKFLRDSRTPWLYQRTFITFVCCPRRKE